MAISFSSQQSLSSIDSSGSELMHLEGKVISLRNQFTFYDNTGKELGTIRKKIVKLIGEEFWVEKDGVEFMRIYGNFTEHDYQMQVNGIQVASVHKKWISVRDHARSLDNRRSGSPSGDWSGDCDRTCGSYGTLARLQDMEHARGSDQADDRAREGRSTVNFL